ncbi:TIGR04063 family PEP-CTERM/XrtA system glycosyltransferase [Pseudoduganella sp. GCM10020061]|uniref:TIGR04063 family PEP-CTERM/XrtA system glycosyltransferase n=1 Tax=Pseudoduganella sp. GCM10020061 TaxID=3317345 RepID=UPI003629D901
MAGPILHVLDHSIPLHSGYAFRTRAILEHQRALGWQTVHVTGPKQGRVNALVEDADGLRFHRTQALDPRVARLPLLGHMALVRALAARVQQVAREVRPALIHAHSPSLNALAALSAGRNLGLPVVYEVRAFWEDAAVDHGTTTEGSLRYRISRALETHALRRASAVTTICEGLRSDIAGRGIDASRITVIPNAVDTAAFSGGALRDETLARRLGIAGKRVLGFIGSFYAYEGLHVLLAALPMMLRADPAVRVLLVGGGEQEKALRAQARMLGVEGCVVFTGRVPHGEVTKYYDLVDVLVYPRLKMRLTDLVTPSKPLEAMAQGRILAASDVGGHRELIEDGRTGVLFEAGCPNALAHSVSRLLASPERWPDLREQARRFVERERTWSASVARYRDVYRSLAGEAFA